MRDLRIYGKNGLLGLFRAWLKKQIGVKTRAGRENLYEPEAESKSWVGEKTPLKMRGIVTAVSIIHERSLRR